MQDKDYTASADFLAAFFGKAQGMGCAGAVELRACPNERGPKVVNAIIMDPAHAADFCQRHDKEGNSVYFGVCTRKPGLTGFGDKANVVSCAALWVDIDCAKQKIPGAEALAALDFLPFPPTIIINSGAGFHAYWELEEPVDVSSPALFEPIEALNRQLVMILAGDGQCAEIARIMRLPGTMNSKDATCALNDGEPIVCEVLSSTGRVYDLAQLAEWLSEQRAVLHGAAKTEIRAVKQDDIFLAYAKEAGYEPAIDIEAELAAMEHGAAGQNSVHRTQLRVSMSMIARGYEDDEIVALILAATENAAPRDVAWNWPGEEKAIRGMIRSGRRLAVEKPLRPASAPTTNGNTALKLVHDAEPAAAPAAAPAIKPAKELSNEIAQAGEAVLGVWLERYGPLIHAQGTSWSYAAEGRAAGVWREWDDDLTQRLRSIVQEACAALKIKPATNMLNAIYRYVMERPALRRDYVEFDKTAVIVAADGCLDLTTFETVPHSPEHYATRKVAADLAGNRETPTLTDFLHSCFSDRPEASQIISTLQEWYGAAIVPLGLKQRAQKKGLLCHGPSRTSKTQISELARFLLGHAHVSGAKMRDLDDRFGVEPFIGKRGWIADDAVGESEYLEAEIYKVVVTGEQTSTRRKGGKNWEGRFGIPVLLTANNLPRVKDQSDATYNRSLILPMTKVRDESQAEPAGYDSISAKIGNEELTGLLWWAIEGWRRLHARGTYAPPQIMLDATRAFKDDNNPVGAWMVACVEPDNENKVARLDLVASFHGWRALEHDDDKPWKSNTITRRIAIQMPQLEVTKLNGERCFGGLRLNDEGLYFWQRTKDTAGFEKKVTFSNEKESVNLFWARQTQSAPGDLEEDDRRPRF